MIRYIQDYEHYTEVLSRIETAKQFLWIGTADIKDLYVKKGKETVPFLKILASLIQKGIDIRLIHAKEPGERFRTDFDKYPHLWDGMERVLCPRVHFKMIIIDGNTAYFGSANLTGAGMGMKSSDARNFECGVLTDDTSLVESAMNQFDGVWMGAHCTKCRRKNICNDRIK